jgi:hypothetical protein
MNFPTGPEGIFLKRGRRVTLRRAEAFPWVRIGKPYVVDRLFYGKSFIYPLVAAPFVRLFGTNGFLVLHALLLTVCFGAGVAWLEARGSPAADRGGVRLRLSSACRSCRCISCG